ncbi:TRAP-type C4-dicarboxylate transport system, periplasmic component [Pseudomonas amygdali pv. ulmi]|uniref:TRAP-type C4-dicarboxylate transport system, periplasmic component n=1 Tax=Pseudomonas amygdali pv. ulmi TaxID=251720 RepID=A0A3M4T9H7_PSEA0|nr:TRAP-type C4-dicarboxylate transport system, periplasmic component [Pseudomonas amygdali pv. ulmi]
MAATLFNVGFAAMLRFPSRLNAVLGALTGLALLISANVAMAGQTLRLAHASSSSSLINQAMTRFAAEVSAETKGELNVQVYPDGQLGDEAPIVDSVGAGAIDIGLGGSTDGIDPRLNALSLPFCSKIRSPCMPTSIAQPARNSSAWARITASSCSRRWTLVFASSPTANTR